MSITDLSKEIEKYLKYLKIKYTFNFNDYFSFFLISNDDMPSKRCHLIIYSWRNRASPCVTFL